MEVGILAVLFGDGVLHSSGYNPSLHFQNPDFSIRIISVAISITLHLKFNVAVPANVNDNIRKGAFPMLSFFQHFG